MVEVDEGQGVAHLSGSTGGALTAMDIVDLSGVEVNRDGSDGECA